ncbi:hypothetical protein RJ640_007726 [Escallonia rubra]|uniref:RNase H type-1 domain-containing protein n=1 Tax=Escallonia rubra TaxID=112253 RepID=A0AA88QKN9_9ASTE|nr:hypothetical protein RJ640_007726 [Escallonia rubra]
MLKEEERDPSNYDGRRDLGSYCSGGAKYFNIGGDVGTVAATGWGIAEAATGLGRKSWTTPRKAAAVRSNSSSASTGPVTRSRARDEMVAPNQVVVPVSKPPVKPCFQFREVIVSRSEKDGVSGSKVPHLKLEENTLHEMPPPSFQYASDADSSAGSQSGSSPGSPKHLVSSPRSESHTFAPSITMQVMMTGSMSIEEQLAAMSRDFEKLTKTVEDKDFQIVTLMNKLELQTNEESTRGEVNETSKKGGANGHHDGSTSDGSLKGNAFDWFDIKPESVDYWEAIERKFLNRFYNMHRSVRMMSLTNTRPASFEELATRAHDMEISIANHGGNSPALPDPRKKRREGKKVERSSRTTRKESLAVTTALLKIPKKEKPKEEKALEHLQEKSRQQPSLKELEGKVYPFPDFDVPGILDFLLEKKIIELPESKRPEESSGYLKDEVVGTVYMVSVHEDKLDSDEEAIGEDNERMLISLQGLPLRFTLQEMLDLPQPAHEVLKKVLEDPKKLYPGKKGEKKPQLEEAWKEILVFRYVPVSRRAEGQSPFVELAELKAVKIVRVPKKMDIQTTASLKQGETSSSEQSSWIFAFKRLRVMTLNKSKTDSIRGPRASAFSRLGGPTGKIDDKNFEAPVKIEARPKEDRETRSLIPSQIKRKTKIDVNNDGILKAKRRTIVIIGQVSGDSKLVINKLLKEYEVKKEDLVPYFCYATILVNKFDSVELEHVLREENRMADALANLATTLALRGKYKVDILVCQQWVLPELLDCRIEEIDAILVRVVEAEDWRQPLIDYLEHGRLPEDIRHKIKI